MKKTAYILLLVFTLVTFSGAAQAASDDTNADAWFASDSDSYSKDPDGWLKRQKERRNASAAAARPATGKQEEKKPKERFQVIHQDDNFLYLMDTQNAGWQTLPYSKTEKIIDVWIKMVEKAGEYSYPQKYYMEHYYLWPSRRQIQFLCELEVTGQPQNAIKEREYDGRNWENLVPGSVEDNIYAGVLGYMKDKDKKEFFKHLPSFSDVMDSWFNVAI
ncbi:MAG: hypothetical protein IJ849_01570 [Selenomonadaceae bacterium]|nr:hypothetical protein [Selenomonadaceae bacterium]